MKWREFGFLTSLFFVFFLRISLGGESIKKVDLDRPENFAEVKKTVKLAKENDDEKRRRKQLRDAGVSEEDIKRIINSERAKQLEKDSIEGIKPNEKSKLSNNDRFSNKVAEKKRDNFDDNNEEEDDEDDNETDDEQDVKINDYKNGSNVLYKTNGGNELNKNSKRGSIENYNSNQAGDYQRADGIYKIGGKIGSTEKHDNYVAPSVKDAEKTKDQFVNSLSGSDSSNYEDWELSRMLEKAGENINDREKFMTFAREAGKIANRREKSSSFMDVDLLNADITYEFEDDNGSRRLSHGGRKNMYAKYRNNGVRYASADRGSMSWENDTSSVLRGKKIHKNSQLSNKFIVDKPAKQSGRFYASSRDEYKARVRDNGEKKYNVVLGKNTMTEKQIQAKNIGAPFPEVRDSKDKRTQYRPQNIAQIAYDKNNRHLQPAVFEKDIISNAFDQLGSPDAVQISRALIDKFGKVDIADEDGNTLLMHAVARGNQSLIATLLAEGASPNEFNKDGFAPIHLAASNGDNVAMYSIMMNGGRPNLRDRDGNTALMYASKMCNADTIRLMLSLGGDPSIKNNSTERTAFDFAAENADDVVITLLERKKESTFRKRRPVELTK